MKRVFKTLLIGLVIVLIVGVAGFVAYVRIGRYPAAAGAQQAVATATVSRDGWLVFASPVPTRRGLILYPGGLVDVNAYAPIARALADRGLQVVLVQMPFDLAVFDFSKADRVIAAHPEIETWAIAGHSLGGAMACQWLSGRPAALADGRVTALVLWGAYCASDISGARVRVLSQAGEFDGLLNARPEAQLRANQPPDFSFVRVRGGNHAMYGDYGPQSGDGTATRPAPELRAEVVEGVVAWLATPRRP